MADILPKIKLYIFISIINALIMLGYNISRMAYQGNLDLIGLLGGFGTSFIPFTSTIQVVLTGYTLPVEIIALSGIATAILSGIQTFVLTSVIANYIPFVDV